MKEPQSEEPLVRAAWTQELAALVQALIGDHLAHALPTNDTYKIRWAMEARIKYLLQLLGYPYG